MRKNEEKLVIVRHEERMSFSYNIIALMKRKFAEERNDQLIRKT